MQLVIPVAIKACISHNWY